MSHKDLLSKLLMGSVAYGAIAAVSAPVIAQDAAAEDEDFVVEEVYVTARKKRELVTEIPMNIATVGTVEIAKRNLVKNEDIFRTVAGAANPRGQLILRGLAGSNSSVPGTTSTFTDGIPLFFDNLFDVDRIEVLRGPQGTLWGSNAIGGTVQVITTKPDLNEFGGKASLSATHERNRPGIATRASAALNFPIVEGELALRVTGSFFHENKRVLNTYTGNIGKDQNHFIRAQMNWQPSEDTRVNLSYITERDTDTGYIDVDINAPSYHYEAILTANPDAKYGYDVDFNFPSCGGAASRTQCLGGVKDEGHDPRYTRYNLMDPFDHDYVDVVGLTIEQDDIMDGIDFVYAGSLQRFKDYGRQAWWSRADANDMFRTWIIDKSKDRQTTHEFRFQSNDEDSPLQWTVGAFYDRFKTLPSEDNQWQYHASDDRSRAIAAALWDGYWGLGDPTQIGRDLYGDGNKNYNSTIHKWIEEELAFFGEATYEADLGDAGKLEITAGLRYYDLSDDLHSEVSGIWIGPVASETITQDGENGTTKKLSVNYMPNENFGIFGVYSEGYRRGGNNGPTAPADCANDENIGSYTDRYSSDGIKNYEIGVKGLAFDRRFQFSSAAYRIDWSGVQASVYMPSCGFSYTANAASARSQGLEFESTAQIAEGTSLIVNAAYTDSKMTSDVPSLGAEDGDDMTMVPKYNFYVALDKEFELYDRDGSVRLEVAGYGKYKTHFNVRDEDISAAYELVNLSGTLQLTDSANFSVHVNNLLDKDIELYRRSRSRGDWSGNALWIEYARERNITFRLDFEF